MTPTARPRLDNAFVAPRDAVERRVADLWQEVLAVAPVGRNDDFFDLGGASLQAFALMSRVHRDFGVSLTPRDLFACGTVAVMAAVIAERLAGGKR